jgi:integrase
MRRRPGIYKRGNIYWITYVWHGRQYFESSHSSESRDAESLLFKRKMELGLGRVAVRPSETLTVNELLDSYIAQIENLATQKRYKLSQRLLIPICGMCRITDVDAFTFDRFKDFRIKEGVSPAGVNRDIAVYRAAFNFAVERRLLTHSPLDGVKLFDEEKNRKAPRVLSFAEEQRILMCCDVRLRLIVTVLLYTGMRVGIEALRIKWTDVDFEEAVIIVAQSKTAAGLRALPMTGFVASELQKARRHKWNIRVRLFQPRNARVHTSTALKLPGTTL